MAQVRKFRAPQADLRALAYDLCDWLEQRDFEAQVLTVEDGSLLVQARQEGGWRAVFGLALATNVVLKRAGEDVVVECGQGRWLDKAVVGVVGLIWLWPIMIPAAIGAWKQSQLPEDILYQVGSLISSGNRATTSASAAKAAPVTVVCPSCGETVAAGTADEPVAFCESCGERLEASAAAEKRFCGNCGAELSSAAKFCSRCGVAADTATEG